MTSPIRYPTPLDKLHYRNQFRQGKTPQDLQNEKLQLVGERAEQLFQYFNNQQSEVEQIAGDWVEELKAIPFFEGKEEQIEHLQEVVNDLEQYHGELEEVLVQVSGVLKEQEELRDEAVKALKVCRGRLDCVPIESHQINGIVREGNLMCKNIRELSNHS